MKTKLLSLLLVLFAASAVQAQTVDAAYRQAVDDFHYVAHTAETMRTTIKASLTATGVALDFDRDEYARRVVERCYGRVIDYAAGVYAKHLTLGELKQATAFFSSPLGQRCLKAGNSLNSFENLDLTEFQTVCATAGQAYGQGKIAEMKPVPVNTDAYTRLFEKYMKATNLEEVTRQTFLQSFKAAGLSEAEAREATDQIWMRVRGSFVNTMSGHMQKELPAADLAKLLDFYDTAVGRKYAAALGAYAAGMGALMQSLQPDIERVYNEMKAE